MVGTSRFVVIGAGGLGCPALLGLTAVPGPSPITIVDADTVDESNLQRQVLYTIADVGAPKAEAARHRLRARRPALRIDTIAERLDGPALDEILAALAPGSVVLECTDDPALKFAANDLCLRRGIPLVVAGVLGWRGQVLGVSRGRACLRCIYEEPPERALACADAGVIGSAAGVLGHLAAVLALRLSAGEHAAGELFELDLRTVSTRMLDPGPRPGCPACAGIAVPELFPRPRAASS
jgi:adenylyltransferase/sulfurtransferase